MLHSKTILTFLWSTICHYAQFIWCTTNVIFSTRYCFEYCCNAGVTNWWPMTCRPRPPWLRNGKNHHDTSCDMNKFDTHAAMWIANILLYFWVPIVLNLYARRNLIQSISSKALSLWIFLTKQSVKEINMWIQTIYRILTYQLSFHTVLGEI